MLTTNDWQKGSYSVGVNKPFRLLIEMTRFGEAIHDLKGVAGLNAILAKVKKTEREFYQGMHEILVAHCFWHQGFGVEFIKVGDARTPDLKVTNNHDEEFYVECKTRSIISTKTRVRIKFWDILEQMLTKT